MDPLPISWLVPSFVVKNFLKFNDFQMISSILC